MQCRRPRFNPWVGKTSWRSAWQPTPVFLPGESHGQKSLVGCSPWGHKRVGRDLVTKQKQKQQQYSHLLALLMEVVGFPGGPDS